MNKSVLIKRGYCYTYLDPILGAIGHIELDYNWLISNYEYNEYPIKLSKGNREEYLWLIGDEFLEFTSQNDIQFI